MKSPRNRQRPGVVWSSLDKQLFNEFRGLCKIEHRTGAQQIALLIERWVVGRRGSTESEPEGRAFFVPGRSI